MKGLDAVLSPSKRVALLVLVAAGCGRGSASDDPRDARPPPPSHDATVAAKAPPRPRWLDSVTIHGFVEGEIVQLEVIDDHIWASNTDRVFRYPLAGGAGVRLTIDEDTGSHLDIHDGVVTVIDLAAGHIYRYGTDAMKRSLIGKSPQLPMDNAGIYGLGSDLIWGTEQGILAMPRVGGKIRTLVRRQPYWLLLPTRDTIYFFNREKRLFAASMKNGKVRALARASGRIRSLQMRLDRVYWMDQQQISSVPTAGGRTIVHVQVTREPCWFALSEDHLIWMERDSDSGEALVRSMALPDGPTNVLLRAPLTAGAAVVHGDRLYFTSGDGPRGHIVSKLLE